eukprot:CFRG8200T1
MSDSFRVNPPTSEDDVMTNTEEELQVCDEAIEEIKEDGIDSSINLSEMMRKVEVDTDVEEKNYQNGNEEMSATRNVETTNHQSNKNHVRRKHIVEEILQTENNYVDQLVALVQLFKRPLENARTSHVPEIDPKEIEQLFSSIEQIFKINLSLLSQLTAKLKNWSSDETIGDIFCSWAPDLAPYTTYINNYGNAMRILHSVCRKREDFAVFIQTTTYKRLTLKDLMIVPVQRIPRYQLLLQELLKHTTQDHVDFDSLMRAHEETKALAMQCNEAKRQTDAIANMDMLSERIVGYDKLVTDARRCLGETNVLLLCEGLGVKKYKRRLIYLFNDILMCAAAASADKDCQLEFKWLVPLHESTIHLLDKSNIVHAEINADNSGRSSVYEKDSNAQSQQTALETTSHASTDVASEAANESSVRADDDGSFPIKTRSSVPFFTIPGLPSRPSISTLGSILSGDKSDEFKSVFVKKKSRKESISLVKSTVLDYSACNGRNDMDVCVAENAKVHNDDNDAADNCSASICSIPSHDESTIESTVKASLINPRPSIISQVSYSPEEVTWSGTRIHHPVHGTHDLFFEDYREQQRWIKNVTEAIESCTAKRENVAALVAEDTKKEFAMIYSKGKASHALTLLNERNRNMEKMRAQELGSFAQSTRTKADELKTSFSMTYDLEQIMTTATEDQDSTSDTHNELSDDCTPPFAMTKELPIRTDRFAHYGGLTAAQSLRLERQTQASKKNGSNADIKGMRIVDKVKQMAGLETVGKD